MTRIHHADIKIHALATTRIRMIPALLDALHITRDRYRFHFMGKVT